MGEEENIEQTEESNEKTVGFEDDWVTVNPSDVAGAEADANEGAIENEEAEGEPEDEPEEEIIVNGKIIITFLNPGYLTAWFTEHATSSEHESMRESEARCGPLYRSVVLNFNDMGSTRNIIESAFLQKIDPIERQNFTIYMQL